MKQTQLKLKTDTVEFIKRLLERELKEETNNGYTLEDDYTKDLMDAYKDFAMADAKGGVFAFIVSEIIDDYEQKLKENEE